MPDLGCFALFPKAWNDWEESGRDEIRARYLDWRYWSGPSSLGGVTVGIDYLDLFVGHTDFDRPRSVGALECLVKPSLSLPPFYVSRLSPALHILCVSFIS